MHIGGLKPCNNVFLAPMAGVTDLPMRELAIELGAGLAVGEMQSADLRLAKSRKTRQRQRHSESAGDTLSANCWLRPAAAGRGSTVQR